MTSRLAVGFAVLTSAVLFAQEESPPASSPGTRPSPGTAPAARPPPRSASVPPLPCSGTPPLTDVRCAGLKARALGPAVMVGRVSDIAIDPRHPFVFYVGLGHGGTCKSGDAGVTFD